MKIGLIILIFFLSISTKASVKTIVCTHPQVCTLLKEIILDYKGFKLVETFGTTSDPHHEEITPLEIKSILKASYLVTGPKKLRPAIFDLVNKSSATKFIMKLPSKKLNHSHFWLFPNIHCSLKKKLQENLLKTTLAITKKNICQDLSQIKNLEKQIISKTGKKNYVLILPHDSFSSYLKSLGIKTYSLTRKGQHHHLNLSTLKLISKLRKENNKTNWYWLIDKKSENAKYIKENDRVININIMGPLSLILQEIEKALI